METNYNKTKVVELRALTREHGLQGYYRLKRAELIDLLRDMPLDEVQRDKPMPMPALSVSVNPRPRSVARPPKPMRPPPPSPESSLAPYELE